MRQPLSPLELTDTLARLEHTFLKQALRHRPQLLVLLLERRPPPPLGIAVRLDPMASLPKARAKELPAKRLKGPLAAPILPPSGHIPELPAVAVAALAAQPPFPAAVAPLETALLLAFSACRPEPCLGKAVTVAGRAAIGNEDAVPIPPLAGPRLSPSSPAIGREMELHTTNIGPAMPFV